MKLDIIIFIVIVVIVCLGAIWAWCDDISCKVWAEQWDDLDKKLKYSKLGLIYPPNNDAVIVKADRILQEDVIKFIKEENLKQLNEEKARVLDNMMCSSKQFEVALEQMRDCINKPEVLTFKKTESIVDNLGPWSDPAWERVDIPLHDDAEPKSKKLQPLLCKMCGGTVSKKGDNYECEYCGLRYEWR